ncbi:F1F0 ATP synthase, subunit G, mitochondrial [Haematococcus lacustris]
MALRRAASLLAQRLTGLGAAEGQVLGAQPLLQGSLLGADCQVRHASNQAVKQRIRAIKNIGKITKAMKMVAASKMRNAQAAVETSRGINDPFLRLFGDYPGIVAPKSVTLAITSDKGLCGGLNSNITKNTRALLRLMETGGEESTENVVCIGDKGRSQLTRTESQTFSLVITDTYKVRVTFAQASLIAEELLKTNPDVVRIVYNKFRSAISFKPTVATVLMPDLIEKQANEASGNKLDGYEMEVSAERGDCLRDLAEFQLAATLYNAMLENNVSEHASRMSAMENSTKSAGEMLSKLTLSYNRKRQASITTELIEIIAGASALVDAE